MTAALEQLAPQFSWKKFLGAAGVALTSPRGERQIIVAEKSAVASSVNNTIVIGAPTTPAPTAPMPASTKIASSGGAQDRKRCTIAEEATSWPMVSAPTNLGGLGFGYKWNMGWMNDTLKFFARDPLYRGYHFDELTFSLMYAFSENYILPFSHDEVVHLKRSLLGRMPGGDEARFAALRTLYGYLYTHPGKKLMFMGDEFGQEGEWDEARSLDWHQLDDPKRRGLSAFVRDLNRIYRETPALYACESDWHGFEWIDCDDRTNAVASFLRRDPASGAFVVVVMNLSGTAYDGYRIGVPAAGRYNEVLNSDAAAYGGRNRGNFGTVSALATPSHGQPASLELYLAPQSLLILAPQAE